MVKKGQITIFIVVGVLILVSIGTIFFIFNQGSEVSDTELVLSSPDEALQSYVTACLQQKTLEGLDILSKQAGFIDTRGVESLYHNEREIPYWMTKNDLLIPEVEFFEYEIENFIDANIDDCLNGFEAFKDQGFVVQKTGNHDTVAEMENQIIVNLVYPLRMIRDDFTFDISEYVINIPINMREIHNMAYDVTMTEYLFNYLEYTTNNMISVYSGVSSDRLPPRISNDVGLDCNVVTWTDSQVNGLMKEIMNVVIPNVKIAGTDFPEPSDDFYRSMIYRFYPGEFENFKVDFEYDLSWPMKTKVYPSSGGSIRPEKIKHSIPMASFCNVKYQFDYDVEYPVLVTVTEKNSARIAGNNFYPGEGFSFQFPIYVWLSSNKPREEQVRVDPYRTEEELLGIIQEEGIEFDSNYKICENVSQKDITITVIDAETKQEIDASISLMCGETECDIEYGEYPDCENAQIKVTKTDYTKYLESFDYTDLEIEIRPLKELTVAVRKVNLPLYLQTYSAGNSIAPSQMLSSQEKAIINLRGDEDVELIYPVMNTAKIPSGDYTLQISMQGPVDVKDTPIIDEFGNEVGVLTGFKSASWPTGRINIPVTIDTEGKQRINFLVFEEQDINKLNPGTWDDIHEAIIQNDNSLKYNSTGTIITLSKDQYVSQMQPVIT